MKFTIELGTNTSVRFQTLDQGVQLSRRQLESLDSLDTRDLCLTQMTEDGILTPTQVTLARKKLLRKMLLVIGGGEL